MPHRIRGIVGLLAAAALLTAALAGCSESRPDLQPERHVLRVGILHGGSESEELFRQRYTDAFEMMYSHVEVELVPALDEWGRDRRTGEPPVNEASALGTLMSGADPVDVVFAESPQIYALIRDHRLMELDSFIAKSRLDLSTYAPGVMGGIKEMGEGKIYALTPTFTASGLFYNKELLMEKGIELPQEGVTWDTVFQLARRIADSERMPQVFGLLFNRFTGNGFRDAMLLSEQEQLRLVDEGRERMLVNTDSWKQLWTEIAGLYIDRISPTSRDFQPSSDEGEEHPYADDLFIGGRAAMLLANFSYANELAEAQRQLEGSGFRVPQWDVMPVPESPSVPGVGAGMELGMLMGINTRASNPEDAWRLVELINGPGWARTMARSGSELPARAEYASAAAGAGYNLDAYYRLRPVPPDIRELSTSFPYYYDVIYLPGLKLFRNVLEGRMTVPEALAEWEWRGNISLKQIKEHPEGPFEFDDLGIIAPK